MNGFRTRVLRNAAILICLAGSAALAEKPATETILTGLQQPCAVAIPPSDDNVRYPVFVADSKARTIVMFLSDRPTVRFEAITGFPPAAEDAAKFAAPERLIDPVSLAFIDSRRLVVGLGGESGGQLRLFDFGASNLPSTADKAAQQIQLIENGSKTAGVPISVHALVRTRANDYVPNMLIAACTHRDGGVRLWKTPIRAETLDEAAAFAPAEHESQTRAALAIAVSPEGFLVVAECHTTRKGDGTFKYYEPVSERVVMQLTFDLTAIVGLAYSPRTGNLYAAGFGSAGAAPGGIFRIDAIGKPGQPACTTVNIADIDRPTALAFGPDGALYVTAFGNGDDEKPHGMVLKITGDL